MVWGSESSKTTLYASLVCDRLTAYVLADRTE